MPNEYEMFFDLLNGFIHDGSKSWKERRDELLENASERDRTNLVELISWDLEAHMPC